MHYTLDTTYVHICVCTCVYVQMSNCMKHKTHEYKKRRLIKSVKNLPEAIMIGNHPISPSFPPSFLFPVISVRTAHTPGTVLSFRPPCHRAAGCVGRPGPPAGRAGRGLQQPGHPYRGRHARPRRPPAATAECGGGALRAAGQRPRAGQLLPGHRQAYPLVCGMQAQCTCAPICFHVHATQKICPASTGVC